MTAAERHQRLTQIVTVQDELAATFMRLDWLIRDLLRAEFPPEPDPADAADELSGVKLPRIRRSR